MAFSHHSKQYEPNVISYWNHFVRTHLRQSNLQVAWWSKNEAMSRTLRHVDMAWEADVNPRASAADNAAVKAKTVVSLQDAKQP